MTDDIEILLKAVRMRALIRYEEGEPRARRLLMVLEYVIEMCIEAGLLDD